MFDFGIMVGWPASCQPLIVKGNYFLQVDIWGAKSNTTNYTIIKISIKMAQSLTLKDLNFNINIAKEQLEFRSNPDKTDNG